MAVWIGRLVCLSLLAACSGPSGSAADAGAGADAGGDDSVDGGGSFNAVTLVVGEEPIAGIHVTTHDAAGLVLEHLVTDASGTLALRVPDGGSFAVYVDNVENGAGASRGVLHVLSPPDGSSWSLPIPAPEPFQDPVYGDVDVTLDPVPEEANAFDVVTPCGGGSSLNVTVNGVHGTCDGTATVAEILAYARSSVMGGPIYGWGMATDVSVTPDGPATPITIDTSNTDFEEVRLTVDGIPEDYRSSTRLRLGTDFIELGLNANNLGAGPGTNSVTLSPPAGITTDAHAVFSFGTENVTGVVGKSFGANQWASSAAAIGTSLVSEFPLAGVELATPDLSVAARPALSWARGPGATGTVGYVEIIGQSASDHLFTHVVTFAPGSAGGELVLPEVPDELIEWRPASTSRIQVVYEEIDPATRFAEWVLPNPLSALRAQTRPDGTYHFARGTFRLD